MSLEKNIGDIVYHSKFGKGTISGITIENGKILSLSVEFDKDNGKKQRSFSGSNYKQYLSDLDVKKNINRLQKQVSRRTDDTSYDGYTFSPLRDKDLIDIQEKISLHKIKTAKDLLSAGLLPKGKTIPLKHMKLFEGKDATGKRAHDYRETEGTAALYKDVFKGIKTISITGAANTLLGSEYPSIEKLEEYVSDLSKEISLLEKKADKSQNAKTKIKLQNEVISLKKKLTLQQKDLQRAISGDNFFAKQGIAFHSFAEMLALGKLPKLLKGLQSNDIKTVNALLTQYAGSNVSVDSLIKNSSTGFKDTQKDRELAAEFLDKIKDYTSAGGKTNFLSQGLKNYINFLSENNISLADSVEQSIGFVTNIDDELVKFVGTIDAIFSNTLLDIKTGKMHPGAIAWQTNMGNFMREMVLGNKAENLGAYNPGLGYMRPGFLAANAIPPEIMKKLIVQAGRGQRTDVDLVKYISGNTQTELTEIEDRKSGTKKIVPITYINNQKLQSGQYGANKPNTQKEIDKLNREANELIENIRTLRGDELEHVINQIFSTSDYSSGEAVESGKFYRSGYFWDLVREKMPGDMASVFNWAIKENAPRPQSQGLGQKTYSIPQEDGTFADINVSTLLGLSLKQWGKLLNVLNETYGHDSVIKLAGLFEEEFLKLNHEEQKRLMSSFRSLMVANENLPTEYKNLLEKRSQLNKKIKSTSNQIDIKTLNDQLQKTETEIRKIEETGKDSYYNIFEKAWNDVSTELSRQNKKDLIEELDDYKSVKHYSEDKINSREYNPEVWEIEEQKASPNYLSSASGGKTPKDRALYLGNRLGRILDYSTRIETALKPLAEQLNVDVTELSKSLLRDSAKQSGSRDSYYRFLRSKELSSKFIEQFPSFKGEMTTEQINWIVDNLDETIGEEASILESIESIQKEGVYAEYSLNDRGEYVLTSETDPYVMALNVFAKRVQRTLYSDKKPIPFEVLGDLLNNKSLGLMTRRSSNISTRSLDPTIQREYALKREEEDRKAINREREWVKDFINYDPLLPDADRILDDYIEASKAISLATSELEQWGGEREPIRRAEEDDFTYNDRAQRWKEAFLKFQNVRSKFSEVNERVSKTFKSGDVEGYTTDKGADFLISEYQRLINLKRKENIEASALYAYRNIDRNKESLTDDELQAYIEFYANKLGISSSDLLSTYSKENIYTSFSDFLSKEFKSQQVPFAKFKLPDIKNDQVLKESINELANETQEIATNVVQDTLNEEIKKISNITTDDIKEQHTVPQKPIFSNLKKDSDELIIQTKNGIIPVYATSTDIADVSKAKLTNLTTDFEGHTIGKTYKFLNDKIFADYGEGGLAGWMTRWKDKDVKDAQTDLTRILTQVPSYTKSSGGLTKVGRNALDEIMRDTFGDRYHPDQGLNAILDEVKGIHIDTTSIDGKLDGFTPGNNNGGGSSNITLPVAGSGISGNTKKVKSIEDSYREYRAKAAAINIKIQKLLNQLPDLDNNERLLAEKLLQSERDALSGLQKQYSPYIKAKFKGRSDIDKEFSLKEQESNFSARRQTKGPYKKSATLKELIGNQVSMAMNQLMNFSGIYSLIMQIPANLKKIETAARNLESVLTDLRVVTGYNRADGEALLVTYQKLGKQLGVTTQEVAQAADSWLRQGYAVEETTELINASMKLSRLGQMQSAEATKALTSALKGFKMEATGAMSIVDKLTKVDMAAAVSAGDIAEGLSRVATSSQLAGLSLDETVGILSTIGEVTQKDMSSVGESLKTLLSRYGNVKAGVYTSMGLNDDGETSENINDIEKVLSKLGIRIRTNNLEMRDISSVLDELAEKWGTLDTVSKNAIATAFAGVRQRENFLVLMENWDRVQELTQDSINSTGTATQKYEAYMDSLEAATKKFENAWEKLSNTLKASWFIKAGVNTFALIAENLDKIVAVVTTLIVMTRGKEVLSYLTGNAIKGVDTVTGTNALSKSPNLLNKIGAQLIAGTGMAGIASTTITNGNQVDTLRQELERVDQQLVKRVNKDGVPYKDKYIKTLEGRKRNLEKQIKEADAPLVEGNTQSQKEEAKTWWKKYKQDYGKWRWDLGLKAGITTGITSGLTATEVSGDNPVTKLFYGDDYKDVSKEADVGDKVTKGVVSGLTTGLLTAIPYVGPILGPAIGPFLGDAIGDALLIWFNKEEYDQKKRIQVAKDNLSTLKSINSTIDNILPIGLENQTLTAEENERLEGYMDAIRTEFAENAEAFSIFKAQLVANLEGNSSGWAKQLSGIQTITGLLGVIQGSAAEDRDKIYRQLKFATVQTEKSNAEKAFEEIENEFKKSDSAQYVKTSTIFYQQELDKVLNEKQLMESGELDWDRDRWEELEQKEDQYNLKLGMGYKSNEIKEYLTFADPYKAVEYWRDEVRRRQDQKESQERIDEANKNLREANSYLEKYEEQNSTLRGYNAQLGYLGADIYGYSKADLEGLTKEGIIYKILQKIETEGWGDPYANKDELKKYRTEVTNLLESDSRFASLFGNDSTLLKNIISGAEEFKTALKGTFYTVENILKAFEEGNSEYIQGILTATRYTQDQLMKLAYAANPERLENFAKAFRITTEQAKNLGKELLNLTTAIGLMSPTEVIEYYSGLSSVLSDLLDDLTLTKDNVATIISKYPELIGEISGSDNKGLRAALYERIYGGEAEYAYRNAVLSSVFSSGEVFKSFKEYLKESGITDLKAIGNASTLENVAQLIADGTIDRDSKIAQALTNFLDKEIEYEKDYTVLNNAIKYQTTLIDDEIDSLTKKKEALTSINEQHKKELELIKARQKLENAKKEKVRVFREGIGWTYQANEDAIAEAMENAENLRIDKEAEKYDLMIEQLEQEKTILEELPEALEMEALKESLDLLGITDGVTAQTVLAIANKYLGNTERVKLNEGLEDYINSLVTTSPDGGTGGGGNASITYPKLATKKEPLVDIIAKDGSIIKSVLLTDLLERNFKIGRGNYNETYQLNASGTTDFSGGPTLINEQGLEGIVTPEGTLTSLPAKSGILPADLTKNLWQLGEVSPTLLSQLNSLNQGKFTSQPTNVTNEEGTYIDHLNMTVYPVEGYDMDKLLADARAKAKISKHNN